MKRTLNQNKWQTPFIAVAVTLAVLLGGTSAALAAQGTDNQEFDRWSGEISDLNGHPYSGKTNRDIDLLRNWLAQAQVLHANDKPEAVKMILQRMDVMRDYISAQHQRLAADERANKAILSAEKASAQATKAKDDATKAAKRKQQLETAGL